MRAALLPTTFVGPEGLRLAPAGGASLASAAHSQYVTLLPFFARMVPSSTASSSIGAPRSSAACARSMPRTCTQASRRLLPPSWIDMLPEV
jgi:hypothetical protein